jgi:tRNA A-37 threonylcarbamoyl transferase component Bud32
MTAVAAPAPVRAPAARSETPSSSLAERRQRSLVDREQVHADRKRLLRALGFGIVCWVAFSGLDVILYLAEDVPGIGRMLLTRGVITASGLPPYLLLRARHAASPRFVRAIELYSFTSASIGIGALAVVSRGLESYQISSITLVLLAHAVTLGSEWRRAIVPVVLIVAAPVLVLGAAASIDPVLAAQWSDRASLQRFLEAYVLVLGAGALTVVGNHATWSLRRQLASTRSLGRYTLRKRIAAGGMGEIWSAYHEALKRDVAVKIMQPRLGQDERAVLRFEREVRALAELSHPHIVRIFDYGATEDGIWYYAMELVAGDDLRAIIEKNGALEPMRALRLVRQAAEALAEAHAHAIVHRDVKPANLLLVQTEGGREHVKLIDFGIAKLGDDAGEELTRVGTVVGTPGYMAPEVIAGDPATPRSDVYALGAVLYWLLAGAPPHEGETPQAVARAHLDREPPPPSARLGRELPAALEEAVMRCLRKDPLLRYADAGELAAALRAIED